MRVTTSRALVMLALLLVACGSDRGDPGEQGAAPAAAETGSTQDPTSAGLSPTTEPHAEHASGADAIAHAAHEAGAATPTNDAHAAHPPAAAARAGGSDAHAGHAGTPPRDAHAAHAAPAAAQVAAAPSADAAHARHQPTPASHAGHEQAAGAIMEPGDAGVFELVGLLLADPSVQARVQADSMLRNLWSDPAVRQQIQQGPGSTHEAERQQADSAAIARVVHQFHAALEAGDSTTALRLLDDDAVILESGDAETKQEYRSHHLPSDIAFARAVPRQSGPVRVVVRGDVAWASSTGVARGRFRDRDVNSQSAELMILERRGAGWVISAIHWSSRAIR